MKKFVALVLVVSLVGLGVAGTIEAPFTLLFGWISFLWRVLPKVTVDEPSVGVGCAALVLFAAGVHWAGRSWQRRQIDPAGPSRKWKLRWSLAMVGGVCVLFVAGICLVGIAHQGIWLFASGRPLVKEVPELRYGGGRAVTQNHLKQIALGLIKYQDDFNGKVPPALDFGPSGTMRHSWETRTLPLVGFYSREIDLEQPWNAPVNQKYFKCVIPVFINPELSVDSFVDAEGYGLNHYSANVHVLARGPNLKWPEISKGASQTILIGEVNAEFKPWGQPGNLRDPARGINRSPHGFGGPPGSGGAQFSMADGSVRFVSDKVSPEILRAMSTLHGSERPDDLDGLAPGK